MHVVDGTNVTRDHTSPSYDKLYNCQRFLDLFAKAIWNWNLGNILAMDKMMVHLQGQLLPHKAILAQQIGEMGIEGATPFVLFQFFRYPKHDESSLKHGFGQ